MLFIFDKRNYNTHDDAVKRQALHLSGFALRTQLDRPRSPRPPRARQHEAPLMRAGTYEAKGQLNGPGRSRASDTCQAEGDHDRQRKESISTESCAFIERANNSLLKEPRLKLK